VGDKVGNRPLTAVRDWQLSGKQYDRYWLSSRPNSAAAAAGLVMLDMMD
jgi:hypothetical protein